MDEKHAYETTNPNLKLPDCCACCLGASEEIFDLTIYPGEEHETTWSFPYCRFCVKHLKGHSQDWVAGGVIGGAVALLGLWIRGFPQMPIDEIFMIVCVAGGITAAVKYFVSTKHARSGPHCSGDEMVVGCTPVSATELRFVFSNEEFGKKVTQLNSQS